MTTAWTAEDAQAAALLAAYFPDARFVEVIPHKENRMTDTAPENVWEGEDAQEAPAFGGATYPEYSYSLADHVYTWSPKLPDGSMLVVRANSADALAEAAEALVPIAGRLRAAWQAVTGSSAPAPQAPVQASQGQPNWNPQMPPPNQPYPGQPAWQQAGAPQAQPAPQWGGGQQQGQRKEYPAPQGWLRLNGARKEQVDAIAQQMGIPKGNPNKGGAYNFFGLTPGGQPGKSWYCSPQAAQAFAQFNPMPA